METTDATPTPTAPRAVDSVLLIASRDYMNNAAVLAHVELLPPTTVILMTDYRTGIGHFLSRRHPQQNIVQIKWRPTRPDQLVSAQRALIFWDGGHDATLLRSLVLLRRHRVPVTIVDLDGNALDLPTFCARLTHNGNGGRMSTTAPVKPSVIVDAPAIAPGESQPRKDSKVRLQFHVPEATVAQYELQARAAGISVEKCCSDRLRTCVNHTSGRGLYFNDAERSDLERITGGHLIDNAAIALQRVKTTITLKVGDITVELNERVLARCTSRAKAERKTLEEYVRKEVIQGLERATGLRPY